MTSVIHTVMSERELAKRDGEKQEPILQIEEEKKPLKAITSPDVPGHSFVPLKEIIEGTTPPERERNEREDMSLPPLEDEISPDSIPL